MSVHYIGWIGSPGTRTRVTEGCKPWCGCWESNLVPLQGYLLVPLTAVLTSTVVNFKISNISVFIYLYSMCLHTCMYTHMCAMVSTWKSEDNLRSHVLPSTKWVLGIEYRPSSSAARDLTEWPCWSRSHLSNPRSSCLAGDYRSISSLIPPFVLVAQGWKIKTEMIRKGKVLRALLQLSFGDT